jgi:hypothetical protein
MGVVTDASGLWAGWSTPSDGWVLIDDGSYQWAVWRGYFDITGLASEDLTVAVLGATVQEGNSATLGNPTTAGALNIWDIMSKEAIPDESFSANHFSTGVPQFWLPPGLSDSHFDLESIFMGRYRRLAPDTAILGGVLKIDEASWGTGTATAAKRIHITRAVFLTGQTESGILSTPSAAYVVPTSIVKERDLVYIERLRRSYVLAENRG